MVKDATKHGNNTANFMTESNLQQQIFKALGGRPDVRLFRNTCGVGWVGNVVTVDPRRGTVTLRNARRQTFGLHVGSGDLIGWRSVVIQPAMVGKTIAVFASIEVKTDKGKISDDQLNWAKQLSEKGGIACIVRSLEEVHDIFEDSDFFAPQGGFNDNNRF